MFEIVQKSHEHGVWIGIQSRDKSQIIVYCLYVLLSFPFEVTELDADDAEDNAPPPPSSPAADFPAVTETINPVPKKNVTAKKTAAKSEPQSLNWVNIGIK